MVDINTIADPQVRLFYTLFLSQRTILRDFYVALPEEQYDYRMVDTPERKSDSPRESLAHLLEQRLIVFNGVKTQVLEFKSMGVEHYWKASKQELLEEWERIEQAMLEYLTDEHFDGNALVKTLWGEDWTRVETLYLIRDHDILHVGWNLALMDHLGMGRFSSLREYWG